MTALQHTRVIFRIMDIVHPRPEQVLVELFKQRELEGMVIAETDSTIDAEHYLVVRVAGVEDPVIVGAQLARALEPPAPLPQGEPP